MPGSLQRLEKENAPSSILAALGQEMTPPQLVIFKLHFFSITQDVVLIRGGIIGQAFFFSFALASLALCQVFVQICNIPEFMLRKANVATLLYTTHTV